MPNPPSESNHSNKKGVKTKHFYVPFNTFVKSIINIFQLPESLSDNCESIFKLFILIYIINSLHSK